MENEHGFIRPADATLLIGGKDDQGRPVGIQAIKMVCQATGEFTRKELSENSVLQWSDLAESIIAEDKKRLEGGASQSGTGTNNNGGGTGSDPDPDNGGGNNGGGEGPDPDQ